MIHAIAIPGREALEKILAEQIDGLKGKIVDMALQHQDRGSDHPKGPAYQLTIIVDAVDGYGFTFNHGMPDLDLLEHDVRAIGKLIRKHLEERNGRNPTAEAGVH